MQTTLHRVFLSHPQAVDESYGEHFVFALGFAARLFGAACAALVHALIPCLFETTASRMIREMHARIASRGHAQPASFETSTCADAQVASSS
jgi:hypothetical protein